MGFREALLKHIELQIIQNLIIDNPEIEYQNDIEGYTNLYHLKFGSDGKIQPPPPGSVDLPYIDPYTDDDAKYKEWLKYRENAYLAPRISNPGYSTALRALHCRPIKNFDVTGLRHVQSQALPGRPPRKSDNPKSRGVRIIDVTGGVDRGPVDNPPQAFLHIVSGEKDIDRPIRNTKRKARVDHQVEYMKVAIDCVFRDICTPQPEDHLLGNGKYWFNQIQKGFNPPEIPEIDLQSPVLMPPPNPLSPTMPMMTTYTAEYHKTLNQQAVGFIEDIESLLDASDLRLNAEGQVYRFGPDNSYQAWIMDANLALWGMLPEAGNSPTDTVRSVFTIEIHYPKVYHLTTAVAD